jgi:hypothetical protein
LVAFWLDSRLVPFCRGAADQVGVMLGLAGITLFSVDSVRICTFGHEK